MVVRFGVTTRKKLIRRFIEEFTPCRKGLGTKNAMEALIFSAREKELRYDAETPIPKITKPSDILIKVAYSGICGTDLRIIKGEFPCIQDKPIILGHEFSGTVVEVGQAVKYFQKGDQVAIDPNAGCRRCHWCHLGMPHYCQDEGVSEILGLYTDGGWAKYAVVPEYKTHQLPEPLTLDQATFVEPISCITHGWDRISPINVGTRILINGGGIIGILWSAFLHLQGHREVTVCEPNKDRLEYIKKLDLGYSLITPDALKLVTNFFGLVIDCSGYAPAMEEIFKYVNFGGTFAIFGCAPQQSKISIDACEVYVKEMKIIGIRTNPYSSQRSLGVMLSMLDRYLTFERLGVEMFDIQDYELAFDRLASGEILKAVFKLDRALDISPSTQDRLGALSNLPEAFID